MQLYHQLLVRYTASNIKWYDALSRMYHISNLAMSVQHASFAGARFENCQDTKIDIFCPCGCVLISMRCIHICAMISVCLSSAGLPVCQNESSLLIYLTPKHLCVSLTA